MKTISSIVIILGLFGLTSFGQSGKIPDEISLAFKAGNVEVLSKYLNTTVELVLLDKEDFYTKVVAEGIIKDFFKEYPTVDFIIKHKGGRSDSSYAIGNLRTRKGNFRVYFLIKRIDSKPLIHQLRIEKDDKGSDQQADRSGS